MHFPTVSVFKIICTLVDNLPIMISISYKKKEAFNPFL